jgi:hypothetical protein
LWEFHPLWETCSSGVIIMREFLVTSDPD